MSSLTHVTLSYPDFKLNEIIDPEQFDTNNGELVNKINQIIDVLHSTVDGNSGADEVYITPYGTLTGTTIQSVIEELSDIVTQSDTNSTNALSTAQSAETKADTAIQTANTANSKSDTAISTANTANNKSDTAIQTANTAKSTADNVETDYNVLKPQMEQAVQDVADKASTDYVDNKILETINGNLPLSQKRTYQELTTLISNNELIPGTLYVLTDYQTKYQQPTTNAIKTMPIEELVLTAKDESSFNPIVSSISYPQDVIYYDFNNNKCEDNTTPRNGFILRRIDETRDVQIDCALDWRTMLWARYKPNLNQYYKKVGGVDTLVGYSPKWTSGPVVKETLHKVDGVSIYMCYKSGTPTSALDINYFYKVCDLSDAFMITDQLKISKDIHLNLGDLVEVKTFGSNCTNNTIRGFTTNLHNNVLKDNCAGNYLSERCHDNTFGSNCNGNTFGDRCHDNIFGDSCNNNTFGVQCYNNTFGNNCYDNTFVSSCSSNAFFSDCNSNIFYSHCYSNIFSRRNFDNTFGTKSYGNIFDNDCYNNTFGASCSNNNLDSICKGNQFGNNCDNNNFGISCSNNAFGDYCDNNTLGIHCNGNVFNSTCSHTSFGDHGNYNTLGNNCSNNTFGNYNSNNNMLSSNVGNTFGNNMKSVFIKYLVSKNVTNISYLYNKIHTITIDRNSNNQYLYWYFDNSNNIVKTLIP